MALHPAVGFSFCTATTSGITSPARRTDYSVTNHDILAPDFILVVQRCIGNGNAAHKYRLQSRNRRQGTGSTHLYVDSQQFRYRFLRRKFMREGKPGSAGNKPELSPAAQDR